MVQETMWHHHVTLSLRRICWHVFWITLVLLEVKSEIPAAVLYKMRDIDSIVDLIQFIEIEREEVRYLLPHSAMQPSETGISSPNLPPSRTDKRGHFITQLSDSKNSEEDTSTSLHPGHASPMLYLNPMDLGERPPVNKVDANIAFFKFMAEESGIAEMAVCEPREQVIEIPSENELNTMYWPPCVTLRRCGGCCQNSLFQCEPQTRQIVNKRLVKMVYNPAFYGMSLHSIVTKELIEDTSCSCECKVKPEHCNPETQRYRNCQCECVVRKQCPPRMRWDQVRCQCVCDTPQFQRLRLCSKKRHTFSDNQCGCVCKPHLRQQCINPNVFSEKKCRCIPPRIRKSIKSLLTSI